MSLKDKLEELRNLMKYYELVSANYSDFKWIIRNFTDEGLSHGVNRVQFQDIDLEIIVDRALSYAKVGPSQEVLKAAYEVENMFKKKTLIQGDTICILYNWMDDDESAAVEERMSQMSFKHGRFDLDTFCLGTENGEQN